MSQGGAAGASENLPARERVLCHGCDHEWLRDEHGLECPQCRSDFVEIIDPNDDPREEVPYVREVPAFPFPQHPLHDHNPWRDTASDPDEEDIDHVSFSPAPGVHFQRTFIRSGGPRTGQRSRSPNDETVGSLFQTLGSFLQGPLGHDREGPPHQRGPMFASGPQLVTQNPFAPPTHSPTNRFRTNFSVNFGGGGGGRNTWTTEDRIFPPRPQRNNVNDPLVGMQAIMATMLQQMQGHANELHGGNQRGPGENNGVGAMGFPELLAQLFHPPSGVHGDAVYSQEDFDRIIGQMMEQQNGSTAPGPASEGAIAALPKRKVDKSMMGSDGKAECSVCMDNVEIGDEVTSLPCNHWFHEQCVSIWLKEHDTCPHCRKGIMPAEGETDTVRSPGQLPRHNTNPFDRPPLPPPLPGHPAAPFTQPGMQHPYVPGGYPSYPDPQAYVQPPPPPAQSSDGRQPSSSTQQANLGWRMSTPRRPSTSSRSQDEGSSRSGGSGGNGGITGWIRNLRNGGRN